VPVRPVEPDHVHAGFALRGTNHLPYPHHRGAGVTVYVSLPPDTDIAAVAARHAAGGVMTRPLTERPWGGLAFDAVIAGYRFLISQPAGDAAPR